MRQGGIFRRCTKCGGRIEATKTKPRCECGSDRFSWAYVVDVAPRGAPREQRTRGGFATKELAVAAMSELQTAIAGGTYVEPSRRTVGAYLAEWLDGRRGEVRGSTWVSYRDAVEHYIAPRIGGLPLQQLDRAAVKALYAALAASGGRGGRPLAVKTVHNAHLALRRALADAVDDRIVARNPADGAHKLPRDHGGGEMHTWTGAQLSTFLEAVKDDELFGLWRLAATTGMRRGEVLGLRWADVDLRAGRLQVVQQRVRGADGFTYGPPKTAKGRRSIDLDPATVAALVAHKRAQGVIRPAFGDGYDADADLTFARADGSPLDPDVVSQTFERLARRLRLPVIRFHDLRHTHATLGLAAGIHPKVMQERLGHSSIAVTMDTYSHAIPALGADAATRIAAIVDGGAM